MIVAQFAFPDATIARHAPLRPMTDEQAPPEARRFLRRLFDAAVAAAVPSTASIAPLDRKSVV